MESRRRKRIKPGGFFGTSSWIRLALLVVMIYQHLLPACHGAVEFPSPADFDSYVVRHHHSLVLVGLETGCEKCNILLSELERVQLRDPQQGTGSRSGSSGGNDVTSGFLSLVAVDARKHKANIRDFDVSQVPTLLWFSRTGGGDVRARNAQLESGRGILKRQRIVARGIPVPEPFGGGYEITAEGISAFLNDKLGPGKTFVHRRMPAARPSLNADRVADGAVEDDGDFVGMILDARTFYATVLNPETFVLVLFCNSWHTDCKDFRSTYVFVSVCSLDIFRVCPLTVALKYRSVLQVCKGCSDFLDRPARRCGGRRHR